MSTCYLDWIRVEFGASVSSTDVPFLADACARVVHTEGNLTFSELQQPKDLTYCSLSLQCGAPFPSEFRTRAVKASVLRITEYFLL